MKVGLLFSLCSFLLIAGCRSMDSNQATTTKAPCGDEVDTIVMRKVLREISPRYNDLSVWLSHDYSEATWKPRLDAKQETIDRIRAWALTLTDRCVREAYLGWLDFCQREVDEARVELRTQKIKLEHEAYDRERKERSRAVNAYQGVVPDPPTRRD